MATKRKLIPKVTSLRELEGLAKLDPRYAALAMAAAENLGCPSCKDAKQAVRELEDYLMALVGEYGESEDVAEKTLIDEINFVRDCI